jgi:peptidoglycan/LPS O-acetylase OafA/YrhL
MNPAEPGVARRHVPALDGIRGLAILVVLVHNFGYFEEPVDSFLLRAVRLISGAGWIGVQLFFVLSGFLITGILLDTQRDAHRFRSFYVRRILRIFPLYYLTLVGAFLILPYAIDLGVWAVNARHVQVWYWTYLMNWSDPLSGVTLPGLSHFWSLAVEEQFYLVWPFVVFHSSGRQLGRICGMLIVSALAFRVLLVALGAPVAAAYGFTIARWDALGWGAALALAARDRTWHARLVPFLRRTVLPVGAGLLVVALLDRGLPWHTPLQQTIGYSLVAWFFAGLVLTAVDRRAPAPWVRTLMESSWLRFFGKYSYGMYVVHAPIHQLGKLALAPWVIAGTAASRPLHLIVYIGGFLIVTTAVAVVVFHLVEAPFLALKDRLAPVKYTANVDSSERRG